MENKNEKQHSDWLTLGQNLLISSQMAEFFVLSAGWISNNIPNLETEIGFEDYAIPPRTKSFDLCMYNMFSVVWF